MCMPYANLYNFALSGTTVRTGFLYHPAVSVADGSLAPYTVTVAPARNGTVRLALSLYHYLDDGIVWLGLASEAVAVRPRQWQEPSTDSSQNALLTKRFQPELIPGGDTDEKVRRITLIEMPVACAVMSGVVLMWVTTITAFGVRFAGDVQAEKADKGANRVNAGVFRGDEGSNLPMPFTRIKRLSKLTSQHSHRWQLCDYHQQCRHPNGLRVFERQHQHHQ